MLGKAETGADDILHSVTILVKPYLLPPPDSILAAGVMTLQTNRHASGSGLSSGFSNSSPDLSRLLTHETKAPPFVMLTIFAELFAPQRNNWSYHFETEDVSKLGQRAFHLDEMVNAQSGVLRVVGTHFRLGWRENPSGGQLCPKDEENKRRIA